MRALTRAPGLDHHYAGEAAVRVAVVYPERRHVPHCNGQRAARQGVMLPPCLASGVPGSADRVSVAPSQTRCLQIFLSISVDSLSDRLDMLLCLFFFCS
jgi:hypothetical protein